MLAMLVCFTAFAQQKYPINLGFTGVARTTANDFTTLHSGGGIAVSKWKQATDGDYFLSGFRGDILFIENAFGKPLSASKGYFADYVELRWEMRKYEDQVKRFDIFRKTAFSADSLVLVASISPNERVWRDLYAEASTIYEYTVRAVGIFDTQKELLNQVSGVGFRIAYGQVSGRIVYEGGTAVEGVRVTAQTEDNFSTTSVKLNGTSSYINISAGSSQPKFALDTAFTFQGWFKPSVINQTACLFEKGLQYKLTYSNSSLTFIANGQGISLNFPANPVQFFHVVAMRSADSLRLMVKYGSDTTYSNAVAFSGATPSNNNAFTIGKSNTGEYFNGLVDEIRIWHKSFDPTKLIIQSELYISGLENGLTSYIRMNEGQGKVAYDLSRVGFSANENHAVLLNTTWSNTIPSQNQLAVRGITDESGNYLISGIPYSTTGSTYTITPFFGTHKFNPKTKTQFIGPGANNFSNIDFIDVSSFNVSGYAYYEGTEFPVRGVNIRVDGRTVTKADGTPITTGVDGKFVFQVPIGLHYLTFDKNGHGFSNARFPAEVGTLYDFQKDLTFDSKTERILDTTLIKVVGKVVGGPLQASKPVGMDKTTNNLGAGKIVLSTEAEFQLIPIDSTTDRRVTIPHHYYSQGVLQSKGNFTKTVTTALNNKQIEIYPDENSGQFTAYLLPEKYTIKSVSAGNYNFPSTYNGTIDLTTAFNFDSVKDSVKSNPVVKPNGDTTYTVKIDSSSFQMSYDFILRVAPSITVTNEAGGPNFWEGKIKSRDGVELNVTGMDGYPITEWPFFIQAKRYKAIISVFEQYQNGTIIDKVPVNDGKVEVSNAFAIYPDKQTYPINSQGKVIWQFQGGIPKLSGDKLQSLQIVAVTGQDGTINTNWLYQPPSGGNPAGEFKAYLLGSVEEGNDFTSKGPAQIDMIIRDPQGSNSYSTYETGNTTTTTTTYSQDLQFDESVQAKLLLGFKKEVNVGTPFFSEAFDIEIKHNLNIGFEASETKSEGNSTTSTITNTKTWQTSSSPDYVGAAGDVFIGRAMNIVYGACNNLNFVQDDSCNASQSVCVSQGGKLYKLDISKDLRMNPEFSTAFQYTASFIESEVIPNLEELKLNYIKSGGAKYLTSHKAIGSENYFARNTTTASWTRDTSTQITSMVGDNYSVAFSTKSSAPNYYGGTAAFIDSVNFYNLQIKGWKDVLSRNEQEKLEATLVDNYSLDAGATVSVQKSTENSSTETRSFTFALSPSLSVETGKAFNSFGVELEVGFKQTTTKSTTQENTTVNSVSQGFQLADEDAGDYFSIDVKQPNSPFGLVFGARGGASRCPYEGTEKTKYYRPGSILSQATLQWEKPLIQCVQASQVDVPEDKPAFFNVQLSNEGNADNWYMVAVDQASNQQGAIIKLDGQPIGNGLAVLVPALGSINKVITIEKNQPAINNFDGIGIILKSTCQDDIADTVSLTAKFQPTCTRVILKDPTDLWVMNDNNQTRKLNIKIEGYSKDFVGFKNILLQTKPSTQSQWETKAIFKNAASSGIDTIAIGNDATVNYSLDMSSLPDRTYDIRAISQCANGTINYSEVHRGTKDTKRPQVFGEPSPGDGVLSPGESISISYNEDIFTRDNFEGSNVTVRGVLNDAKLDHSSALQFDGIDDYCEVASPVDISDRSWSAEMWVKRNKINQKQVLFRQGDFEFGFNQNNLFYFEADSVTYNAPASVASNNFNFTDQWIHLAVAYDAVKRRVNAYKIYGEITDPVMIDNDTILGDPSGAGMLYFGKGLDAQSNYGGYMHDVRIWGRAINQNDISSKKDDILKGDELNLAGLWPMNELEGTLAKDLARAHHATIQGAAWAVLPSGNAVTFNGSSNLLLPTATPITNSMDFTVEFWFKATKADGAGTVLMSNGKTNGSDFAGTISKNWEVGFNTSGQLYAKNNNATLISDKIFLDDKWHSFSLVLRRKANLSLYVDGNLEKFTNSGVYGSFEGVNLTLGCSRRAGIDTTGKSNFFKGSMDEFRVWNLAKSKDGLELDRFSRLSGEEMGLIAYYPFDFYNTSAKLLQPTLKSQLQLRKLTNGGTFEFIPDTAVAISQNVVFNATDVPRIKLARPVQGLKYSTVVSKDKVIIKLNDDPSLLEKTIVQISVQQVEDLFGNTQASPETWTAFIRNNTVLWDTKDISLTKKVNDPLNFTVNIKNVGGAMENFTISNLPAWLTVSKSTGTIDPLGSIALTFTVNPSVNIGSYVESLYLTTNFGFNEVFELNLKVLGETPDWKVSAESFAKSMNIVAIVKIDDVMSTDEDDLVGAYVGEELRGVSKIKYFPQLSSYLALIDVYSNTGTDETIEFRVWDASAGKMHINVTPSIVFAENEVIGTLQDPVVLNATNILHEPIALKKGWNWISFPLNSTAHKTSQALLAGMKNARTNDLIKSQTSFDILNASGVWTGVLTSKGGVNNREGYRMFISGADTINYQGKLLDTKKDSLLITLKAGWNWIGFPVLKNLSLADAFTNFIPKEGDVIKGQVGFSIYSSQQGWIGSLQTLSSKKSYMYKSASAGSFKFPASSSFKNNAAADPIYAIQEQQKIDAYQYPANMSLVAMLDESEFVEGVQLLAYHNGVLRGVSQQIENKYFSTLYGHNQADEFSFYVVDNNGKLHEVVEKLNFSADQVLGSLEKPVLLHLKSTGVSTELEGSHFKIFPTIYKDVVNFDLSLSNTSTVTIEIFDVIGKKLATVFDGQKSSGNHSIQWVNAFSLSLEQGVHIARISIDGNVVANQRLVHIK